MKNKDHLFSVVLLKESTLLEQKNIDNTKIFEESIILLKTEEDFFENNSQEYLINYFKEKIPPLEYENSYGETIRSSIVLTVEYFEIIDTIVENIIDKHYGGFVFKK